MEFTSAGYSIWGSTQKAIQCGLGMVKSEIIIPLLGLYPSLAFLDWDAPRGKDEYGFIASGVSLV
jgi:hypothetical protein